MNVCMHESVCAYVCMHQSVHVCVCVSMCVHACECDACVCVTEHVLHTCMHVSVTAYAYAEYVRTCVHNCVCAC